MIESMNPAQRVIEKCGGPQAVAEMVGLNVSNVHRWTYPKARGGSDGLIPSQHIQAILNAAHDRGIELETAEFFHPPGDTRPETEGAAA